MPDFVDDGVTNHGPLPTGKSNGHRAADDSTVLNAREIEAQTDALNSLRGRVGALASGTLASISKTAPLDGDGTVASPLVMPAATAAQSGYMSALRASQHDHMLSRINVLDYGAVADSRFAAATMTVPAANALVAGKHFTLNTGDAHTTQIFRIRKAGDGLSDAVADVWVVAGEDAITTAGRVLRGVLDDRNSRARLDGYCDGGTIHWETHAIGTAGNQTNSVESGIGTGFTLGNFTGGATGTDNRAAFVSAKDAAQAIGATLYVPNGPGHYLIQVDNSGSHDFVMSGKDGPIDIMGDGVSASGVVFGLTGGNPNAQSATGTDLVIAGPRCVGDGSYRFRHLKWMGPTGDLYGTNSQYDMAGAANFLTGLHFYGFSQILAQIDHCSFRNFSGNDIMVDPAAGYFDLTITDTYVHSIGASLQIGSPSKAGIKPSRLVMANNKFRSTFSDYDDRSVGVCTYLYPWLDVAANNCEIDTFFLARAYAMQLYGVDLGADKPSAQVFANCTFRGGNVTCVGGYAGCRPKFTQCTFDARGAAIPFYVGDLGADLTDCIFVGGVTVNAATGPAVQSFITATASSVNLVRPVLQGAFTGAVMFQGSTQSGKWLLDGLIAAAGATAGAIVSQDAAVTGGDIELRNIKVPAGVFARLSNNVYAGDLTLRDVDASATTAQLYATPGGGQAVQVRYSNLRGVLPIVANSNVTYPEATAPTAVSPPVSKVTSTNVAGTIIPFAAASGLVGDDILKAGQSNDHELAAGQRAIIAALRAAGIAVDEPVPQANLILDLNPAIGVVARPSDGAASEWDDQSSGALPFLPIVSPTWHAKDTDFNGRSSLEFTAASSHDMNNSAFAALDGLAGACTYVAVKANGTAPNQVVISTQAFQTFIQIASDVIYVFAGQAYGYCAFTSTAKTLLTVAYDGGQVTDATKLRLRINGVPQVLTFGFISGAAVPATLPTGAGMSIGKAHDTGLHFFDGKYGRGLVYGAAHNAAANAVVETLLGRQLEIAI